jgi:tRNA threonylcarbamoyladenosine biosynthesis protein TsaB
MIKLLVDTSGKEIGIGLFKGKNCLCEEYRVAEKTYNKLIIPMIDEILKHSKLRIEEIDLFGATLGPGSFTGIRVGISVMKAFSQVLNKKFYGLPVLDIMANSVNNNDKNVILMDAGRKEFYFTRFDSNKKDILKYELIDENTIKKLIRKNDVIIFLQNDLYVNEFVSAQFKENKIIILSHIDMKIFNDIIEKNNYGMDNFVPLYIRQPDAVKNLTRLKNE